MQDKKVGMGRDGWDDMGGMDWIGREVLEGRDGKGGGKEGMGGMEWIHDNKGGMEWEGRD